MTDGGVDRGLEERLLEERYKYTSREYLHVVVNERALAAGIGCGAQPVGSVPTYHQHKASKQASKHGAKHTYLGSLLLVLVCFSAPRSAMGRRYRVACVWANCVGDGRAARCCCGCCTLSCAHASRSIPIHKPHLIHRIASHQPCHHRRSHPDRSIDRSAYSVRS